MKNSRTPSPQSKAQVLPDAAVSRIRALHEQGLYQEALDISLQVTRTHPKVAEVWVNAAVSCLWLRRWQDAVRYGQIALARGCNRVELYDALANAHGMLGQPDEASRYGLQSLNMSERRFGGAPVMPPPEPGPMPPLPSAQTRERNVIAFSLFGGNSKYCEPAVLNAQEQPQIYPHWVCRFYVDDSVPDHVINRLRASGGQIVPVAGVAAQWPGPMWRFLALDDPSAHRILFRDADSVISQREAGAVQQWLTSGKRFHVMRDDGSHTALIAAGLWGVVAGSLPPLEKLMLRFMSAPLDSRHFADQDFLCRYVWPYARTSLMQHDSVFGFMGAAPFPDEKQPGQTNVGHCEGYPLFSVKSDLPDGSKVVWELYLTEKRNDDGQLREERVCAYPATVNAGAIKAHIPLRYARQMMQQGTAGVRLISAA
jgi:hypothetical protein